MLKNMQKLNYDFPESTVVLVMRHLSTVGPYKMWHKASISKDEAIKDSSKIIKDGQSSNYSLHS